MVLRSGFRVWVSAGGNRSFNRLRGRVEQSGVMANTFPEPRELA